MSNDSVKLLKELKSLAKSIEKKRTTGEMFADDMEDLLGKLTSLDVKQFTAGSEPPKKAQGEAYLLCEECELGDGIRQFTILEASHDRDAIDELLEAKAKKDETGLLGKHGVEDWSSGDVTSIYNEADGFIRYYTQKVDILSREQALEKLNTEEYKDTFQVNPGLRDVVLECVQYCMEDEGFILHDPDKAVDALLDDAEFKGMVKTSWWYGFKSYEPSNKSVYSAAKDYIIDFLGDRQREEPNWIVDVGAANRFEYPDGMDKIMLYAVYDVSKAHALPLSNPQYEASEFLKYNDFYELFNALDIHDPQKLTNMQQVVYDLCYKFVEKELAPKEKENSNDFSTRVAEANRRAAIATQDAKWREQKEAERT